MDNLHAGAAAAARQCVVDWARVQPGEHVLLLRDTGTYTDEAVVQTFAKVVQEAGGVFSLAACPVFNARVEEPPRPIRQALKGADVVLYFSPYPALRHCMSGREAMMEHGLRIVPVLTPTLETLASAWAQFPVELSLMLHQRCREYVADSPPVHVLARNGTDISGLTPLKLTTTDRNLNIPGLAWHGIWPGEVGPCLEPMRAMNGLIVVDVMPGFKGILDEKVHIEVRDNHIHRISGGAPADWFRRLVDDSLAKGSDASLLYELHWGVNPKGDIQRALLTTDCDEVELSRSARTMHFGFGSGSRGFHWDTVIVDNFSIRIGDADVYQDGRFLLLDDPDVRAAAARYGDPDAVLAEVSA